MPVSKLEAELMKVTKLRQAAGEARHAYLLRLLQGGQGLTKPLWNTLSADAQRWYNDGVNAFMAHNIADDIPDFPDLGTERATLTTRPPEPAPEATKPPEAMPEPEPVEDEEEIEPEDEPVENGEDEEPEDTEDEAPVEDDEEFEEDVVPIEEPEDEPLPLSTAASKPAPTKKPAAAPPPKATPEKPKPAVKKAPAGPVKQPLKRAAGKGNGEITRPPRPAAPGASTLIKRMLLRNVHVTNAELMEKLREKNITVTAISVSTIRSDFRHSIKVLHEAGLCKEIEAP